MTFLKAEIKALWVPIWEITRPGKIDTLFQDIRYQNFNQLLVQVRYRGDAAYIPNKRNKAYPNEEVKYHGITDSDFDPLGYIIKEAKKRKIEVHAWFTTFIITGHDLTKLDSSHVYFLHPEWVTTNFSKESMKYHDDVGAFLDPGIPAVQEYTINVILDVLSNYQLDGIHLDYIRYPAGYFGFNKLAMETYKSEVKYQDATSWIQWKNDQITRFVARISMAAKEISPNVKISAAVFPSVSDALERYSQDWKFWLEKDYIDAAYTMSYTKSTDRLESDLTFLSNFGLNDKIVVGLRAWQDGEHYAVGEVKDKIKLIRKMNFAGFSLFSYTGLKNEHYKKYLRIQ
ncbi:MAG: family 10 glycosylhydrolase [Candidatus Cloacimonetes bacterium]|nr:family 10 glycosylhydrolase [Candidatus Cloacimonadota bacterium]